MRHATANIITSALVLSLLCPTLRVYATNSMVTEWRQDMGSRKVTPQKRGVAKRKRVARRYTQKELARIKDLIERRLPHSKGPAVSGYGIGQNCVEVSLWWNTKENQRKFLRHVCNSPAIRFGKTLDPVLDNRTGISSYQGITIRPNRHCYPASSTEIDFTLTNNSGHCIDYGERFYVTAQNENGKWYRIPGPNIFHDVAHVLESGSSGTVTATLYPAILANKPGTYRFFFPLHIDGENVLLMAYFRLGD